ncbi:hypothetical protein KC343_g2172 [Hortaea werneckii]|nr:hypothetical protein KC352_g13637 [Hortaea werneckii]KAI7564630.1 hypothetical protein KC317_g6931 [Hortaea werneckii]KAI7615202.1 hypothetical protein KC346_g6581 [Hortaea werneckii]KAI7634856.1 hypothetical protein KC343_g2172 [Hortaea werneckii]KAI7680711.1 hypothetical protein KC319_g2007 [Hortaea werneckii]
MAGAATPQDSTVNGTPCEDTSPNANEHEQPGRTTNTTSQPVSDVPHDQNSGQPSVTSTQIKEWLNSWVPSRRHKSVAKEYIETFKSFIGPELWDAYFEKMDRRGARAMSFVDSPPRQHFHLSLDHCLRNASSTSCSTIVLIDIAPEWVGVLGGLFNIDLRFFIAPDANEKEDKWNNITDIDSRKAVSDVLQGRSYQSMDLFGHLGKKPVVLQSNIWKERISYCKLGESKHLLLIDGHRWTKAPRRPRGDILIADQDDHIIGHWDNEAYLHCFSRDKLALFASQRASSENHFAVLIHDVLRGAHDILDLSDSEEFFLHLTATRCKADVSEIEKQVKQISDADIADSDTTVFGQLHDLRRAVARLRSIATTVHGRTEGRLRKDDLQRLTTSALDECANLRILIDETIQLVMGTITIKEAQTSRVNSERATVLTFLACIYLPLSLVTGIFGMNIKEINGGAPSWYFCLIALVVIAFGTLGLGFWLLPTESVRALKLSASWAALRSKATVRYTKVLPGRERLRALLDLENPQTGQPDGDRHDFGDYKTVG